MAGDWLKVRVDVHDAAEVIATAADLGKTENEVVGACVKLWGWANRQTRDGNAPGVTGAWIDRYVNLPGFATSLARHGWLALTTDGFAIPNFDRHNGTTAKARATTSDRVRSHRQRQLSGPPSVASPSDGNGVGVTAPLPEKRREEKREENTPLPPKGDAPPAPKKSRQNPAEWDGTLPAALDVPAFRDAWGRWEADRRARKKPLTAEARRLSWRSCEAWGVEKAVASIEQSITHGWQGLFEPDGKRGTGKHAGQVEADGEAIDRLFGGGKKP